MDARSGRLGRTTLRVRAAFLSLLLSPLLGVLPMSAVAAAPVVPGGWRPPVALSHTNASGYDVAMAGRGRAVAAWYEHGHLQLARRSQNGRWHRHRVRTDNPVRPTRPAVAVNEHGAAIVVYRSAHDLWGVRRPRGGPWGRPHRLLRATLPHVALTLDGKGVATIFVGRFDVDIEVERMTVIRSGPGWSWSARRSLGLGDDPHAVVGPHGGVTLAWWGDCTRCGISAATHRPGHRWRIRRAVLEVGTQPPSDLAADATGRVYLANVGGEVLVSRRPGAPWHVERAGTPFPTYDVRLAAAGHGRAVAVFTGDLTKGRAAVTVRRPDGSWTPLHRLPRATAIPSPTITPEGPAAVTAQLGADPFRVGVATAAPGAPWTALGPVFRGRSPHLVSGRDEHALLLLLGHGGSSSHLRASYRSGW
jgi:hypothetical protein